MGRGGQDVEDQTGGYKKMGNMDFREIYISFDGRFNRARYWLAYLPLILISLVATYADFITGNFDPEFGTGPISGVVSIILIWPSLSLGVKRCHDRDRSGWFLLIALIPILGAIWLLVEIGFMKGSAGENRFGPDPLAAVETG